MAFIVSFVGKSNTGKTQLMLKLVPEFVAKGYRTAVVKNCPHGFELDKEGKDSWKFNRVGAQGVMLTSSKRIGLIEEINTTGNMKGVFERYFHDYDLVLVEGLRSDPEIDKVEFLRKGVGEIEESEVHDTLAYISDIDLKVKKPVFHPDDIPKLVHFLEQLMGRRGEP